MIKRNFKDLKIGDKVIVECSPHYFPGNKNSTRKGVVNYRNNFYVNIQFEVFGDKFNESFTKIDVLIGDVKIYEQ